MKVTVIAKESLKDGFGVDYRILDEIYGEDVKYSQYYIWAKYAMKNNDSQAKVKVVEGTIKKYTL